MFEMEEKHVQEMACFLLIEVFVYTYISILYTSIFYSVFISRDWIITIECWSYDTCNKVKYCMAIAAYLWIIYYHSLWSQLSTSCSYNAAEVAQRRAPSYSGRQPTTDNCDCCSNAAEVAQRRAPSYSRPQPTTDNCDSCSNAAEVAKKESPQFQSTTASYGQLR